MGVRAPLPSIVPVDVAERLDQAVRPYRDTLREVRSTVARVDMGLLEPMDALHLIAATAIRQLGEGPPR